MTSGNHRECGRPRYQKGCQCEACVTAGDTAPHKSCPVCVEANRVYARQHRKVTALTGGLKALDGGLSDQKPADPQVKVWSAEHAVKQAIAQLRDRAEAMPDLAAGALAMGRLLDDPTAGPQHPAAYGQLRAGMKELRAGGQQRGGKLTAMRGGRG